MSGYWSATTATTPATISAPASAAAAGEVLRIRGLAASGTGTVTVTDSNAGVIWQVTLPTSGLFNQADLDIRGSVGGNLSVAAAAGSGVSVQGDFVPQGYPYGLT